MQSAAAVPVSIRPSRRLAALVLAAHVLAGLSLFLANLPDSLLVLLLIGVGASLARQRKSQGAFELLLRSDGRVGKVAPAIEANVGTRGGTVIMELHPLTTRLGPLVVLLFRGQSHPRSVSLLPDSVADATTWHELLLWLRWRTGASQVTP